MAEQSEGVRILVIGESLVDVVEGAPGAAPGQTGYTEHVGGSPLNIAYGLARLGRPVELLTAIGPDARGNAITDHLEAAGVAVLPASNRTEPTSSATARLREDGSADYVFDLRWSLPDDSALLAEELEPAIVHTGSIAAFLEPGGSAIVGVLAGLAASEHPPLVTVDPNMRPSIIADHGAALERFAELAALASVLKLSDEDAEWLFPGASVDEAIDRILRLGPALVAVTRGGEGAVLATARDRVVVPGVRVEVADTIGAGDSFMSALISSLAGMVDAGVPAGALRSGEAFDVDALERLGAFSVRCAAVTVSRAGANPPTLAEVAG